MDKKKTLAEITKKDIDNASRNLDESSNNDVIYINGIPFKNVHMPLDEYASKIGAIPYSETKISKIIISENCEMNNFYTYEEAVAECIRLFEDGVNKHLQDNDNKTNTTK